MARDYYDILGVSRKADEKEIKRAYRRLARKYHPDINPGDASAESRFKEINEAYQVLSDAEKRSLYDRVGPEWENAARTGGTQTWSTDVGDIGFDFGGSTDFSGLFENLFGKGRVRSDRAGQYARMPGEDVEYPITISFDEAYRGTTRTIGVNLSEECPECHGTGGEKKICPKCNGTGQDKTSRGILGIGICNQCQGTGQVLEHVCGRCEGKGTVASHKKLEVKIPAGVSDGQRIRMANQGGAGVNGGPRGDLYLIVHVTPHPFFRRDGDNLIAEIPVTFAEAALGAEIKVPTMTGEVRMTIPAGTQSGQTFRLKGKGMPRLRKDGYGDLLVKVNIVTPKNPSPRETELIRELASLREDSPRASLKA